MNNINTQNIQFQPFTGVSGAVLVHNSFVSRYDGYKDSWIYSDNHGRIDVNLLLGVDMIYSRRIVVGMEYNIGFIDAEEWSESKHRTLIFTTGILF